MKYAGFSLRQIRRSDMQACRPMKFSNRLKKSRYSPSPGLRLTEHMKPYPGWWLISGLVMKWVSYQDYQNPTSLGWALILPYPSLQVPDFLDPSKPNATT